MGARDADGLTVNQAKFVAEYLASGNATDAYRKAGYTPKSEKVMRSNASQLLTNTNVIAALERHRRKATEDAGVTAEWVTGRLKREATLEGDGASHAARIAALRALADILGMGEARDADGVSRRPVTVRIIHEAARPGGEAQGGPAVLAAGGEP